MDSQNGKRLPEMDGFGMCQAYTACMSLELAGIEPPFRISPDEPLSVEEFWRFSAENPELRLERSANGEIIVMTPTQRGTGFRGAQIIAALHIWAEQDGRGYEFDSSTGFTLPDGAVLSPDASWIHRSKWTPEMEDEYRKPLAPDFAIELRSKTDSLQQLREKMKMWIANGVGLAWLVDPSRKTVEIYRPGREPEVLEGGSAVEGEGLVAGFVLELARIWG
jgi:Uma2 family endonuclease